MKLTIENGKISFDYHELFDHLSGDELDRLVQSLSCQNEIIRQVIDQIFDGWTKDGYHGGKGYSGNFSTPLDEARYRIAKESDVVTQGVIQELKRALKQEKESCQHWVAKYHEATERRPW